MRFATPLVLTLCVSSFSGAATSTAAPSPLKSAGGKSFVAPAIIGGEFVGKYSPEELSNLLEREQMGSIAITGEPRCTISIYRVRYYTQGAAGETTDASTAIVVPSGDEAQCAGARPVLLYAHGTSVQKSFDMTDLRGNPEARMTAAMFAAQGYILVAPNYAGYAGSSLDYHAYLDAAQQSTDMIDGLRAARASFASIGARDSDHLFVTGYSQGGYVALATQRAMQERGARFRLTAAAAMSGPYALAAFGDAVFGGAPTPGMTVYLPMIINAAQRAGAQLYSSPGEIFEDPYASGIETLLPGNASTSELFRTNKLPSMHLFARDSHPQTRGHEAFFGDGNLIRTSYRNHYLADMRANPCGDSDGAPLACAPAHPLRKAAVKNDLRAYRPSAPVMLCAGNGDPVVPYANTVAQHAYWRAVGGRGLTVLDLDRSPKFTDPYRKQKLGFRTAKATLRQTASERGQSPEEAVAAGYHAGLVPPYCMSSVRQFFRNAMR